MCNQTSFDIACKLFYGYNVGIIHLYCFAHLQTISIHISHTKSSLLLDVSVC